MVIDNLVKRLAMTTLAVLTISCASANHETGSSAHETCEYVDAEISALNQGELSDKNGFYFIEIFEGFVPIPIRFVQRLRPGRERVVMFSLIEPVAGYEYRGCKYISAAKNDSISLGLLEGCEECDDVVNRTGDFSAFKYVDVKEYPGATSYRLQLTESDSQFLQYVIGKNQYMVISSGDNRLFDAIFDWFSIHKVTSSASSEK